MVERKYLFKKVLAYVVCMVMLLTNFGILAPAINALGAETTEKQTGKIVGNMVDIDFDNYTFPASTEEKITIDNTFVGYILVESGNKEVTLADDGSGNNVLKLNAINTKFSTYKSGMNLTDNFGIECRVRFNNTTSNRGLGGMKGINQSGNYAWLDMLKCTNQGKFTDATNTQIGTYVANVWYTIQMEVDTPNQKYRVRIKGDNGEVFSKEQTLNVGGAGNKEWYGCTQTSLFTQDNGTSGQNDTMEIAYLKVGEVLPDIEEIEIENVEMYVGEEITINPSVQPSNAYTEELTYNSSDESIVKVSGNKLKALKSGIVTITAQDNVSGLTSNFRIGVNGIGKVTGNIVDIDFNDYTLPEITDDKVTIDNCFLGYIGVSLGNKEATIVDDETGTNVLKLNAINTKFSTYKSGMNLTNPFKAECCVRFNNTTSNRALGGMKGINQNGNYAWLDLIKCTNQGKFTDAKNQEIGTYVANVWYRVQMEIDTPNQVYRAFIKGDNGDMFYVEQTLNVGGAGTKTWYGCTQTSFFTQDNGTSGQDDTMEIAYFKAGDVFTYIEEITSNDIEMNVNEGELIEITVMPVDAYTEEIVCVSDNEQVVKVFETGVLAVGIGEANVRVEDLSTGKFHEIKVTVNEAENNWDLRYVNEDILNYAVSTSLRPQIDYNEAQIRELFENNQYERPEHYIEMDEEDFIAEVEADLHILANAMEMENSKYEKLSKYLILMYRVTGEEEYAERAATILYSQAKYYPRVLTKSKGVVMSDNPQLMFGESAVFAFGYLVNMEKLGNSVWERVAPEGISAGEMKETIVEMYLRPMAYECMKQLSEKERLGNLDGYGVRTVSVLASIINDPVLMREIIAFHDRLLSEEHYYFDGMWEEGTTSYGSQVIGNALSTIEAVSLYEDPSDFEDSMCLEADFINEAVLGIELPCSDLITRWPLIAKTGPIEHKLVYPDGSLVPISDTWYKTTSNIEPIKEELLCNYELPGFGYYGLVQGTVNNAVQTGLLYESVYRGGGGHEHLDTLSMTLWGAGTELLADPGYAKGTLRFPAMRWSFHNMPFIIRADGKTENVSEEWSKPRLLSYDDGSENSGIITLVEASSVGPETMQIDLNQRLLMNIQLDESHSYVFDLSRMKGGDVHHLFQRGSELEDMNTSENNIVFVNTEKESLRKVFESDSYYGKSKYLIKDFAYMYNPKEADGSEDFSITWEGTETGSRLTTYMNGVNGSKVYLSSIPAERRSNPANNYTDYLTPHITRYNPVSEGDLTKYGAVHETTREGEENLIENVEWSYLVNDNMGICAEITSENYIDYIYVSGDSEERTIDGFTFAGHIAMLRCNRENRSILYAYVYGAGKAGTASGVTAVELPVIGLQTAPVLMVENEENRENVITVQGTVPDIESYVGKRVQLVFGDDSGYGMKIKSVEEENGIIALVTEEYVPMALTDDGVVSLFHPYGDVIEISGNVTVIFEKPTVAFYSNSNENGAENE